MVLGTWLPKDSFFKILELLEDGLRVEGNAPSDARRGGR